MSEYGTNLGIVEEQIWGREAGTCLLPVTV